MNPCNELEIRRVYQITYKGIPLGRMLDVGSESGKKGLSFPEGLQMMGWIDKNDAVEFMVRLKAYLTDVMEGKKKSIGKTTRAEGQPAGKHKPTYAYWKK